jgi:hypothetical protein
LTAQKLGTSTTKIERARRILTSHDEETRSVIVSTFTSMADCFLRGMLRKLFCTTQDFKPEDTFDGRIIILNLPVKEHNELGQFSQVLFKYIWQRAVERRIPPLITPQQAEQTIRPVFLWADESQFFANSYDALFQSTARSSRACTVYLPQNLPSYFAAFGGANSHPQPGASLRGHDRLRFPAKIIRLLLPPTEERLLRILVGVYAFCDRCIQRGAA